MAVSTKALQAKRDRLKLQREIAVLESEGAAQGILEQVAQQATLMETAFYSSDRGGTTVVDRMEYLYDDPTFGTTSTWSTQPSDHHRGDNYPHWRTETELAEIRGICRFLANVSETAIGIRDSRRNFIVGQGFEVTVEPKAQYKEDSLANEIASRLTGWLEKQMELNAWLGEYEFEAFNTLLEDGEQIWIVEPDAYDKRLIRWRMEQPDFLTGPEHSAHVGDAVGLGTEFDWKYGVASPFDESWRPMAYYVCPYASDNAKVYRPSEIEHVRCNVRRYVKRGVSDFYPVWRSLRNMEKLFGNTVHGAAVQAAIAYIREHAENTSSEQIKNWVSSRAESTITQNVPNGTRDYKTRKAVPGTVIDIGQGAKYHAGPLGQGQSPIYIQVIQQALRIVGIRWQMPEYMVSGDASNANYASTMVSESPFVKSCESYQYWYAQQMRRLFSKVINCGIREGLIEYPRNIVERYVSVSVEGQDVATRDEDKAHQLRKSQHENGMLSLQSWAAQEGIDLADEQAKGAKPQQTQQPAGQPTFESWFRNYP